MSGVKLTEQDKNTIAGSQWGQQKTETEQGCRLKISEKLSFQVAGTYVDRVVVSSKYKALNPEKETSVRAEDGSTWKIKCKDYESLENPDFQIGLNQVEDSRVFEATFTDPETGKNETQKIGISSVTSDRLVIVAPKSKDTYNTCQ